MYVHRSYRRKNEKFPLIWGFLICGQILTVLADIYFPSFIVCFEVILIVVCECVHFRNHVLTLVTK